MARKAIVPDEGLTLAVARYAGGGAIHTLYYVLDKYLEACQQGSAEMAGIYEKEIRRKLVANTAARSYSEVLDTYLVNHERHLELRAAAGHMATSERIKANLAKRPVRSGGARVSELALG